MSKVNDGYPLDGQEEMKQALIDKDPLSQLANDGHDITYSGSLVDDQQLVQVA
jgi:hypothetical protein